MYGSHLEGQSLKLFYDTEWPVFFKQRPFLGVLKNLLKIYPQYCFNCSIVPASLCFEYDTKHLLNIFVKTFHMV